MRGSSAAHTKLVKEILVALGCLPGVIAAANPCGVARYTGESGRSSFVAYGWPTHEGSPDILVVKNGVLTGLEAKTGNATTTKEPRACHEALRAVGGAVHVVRSVDGARAALDLN
jgi:hypothetical protein